VVLKGGMCCRKKTSFARVVYRKIIRTFFVITEVRVKMKKVLLFISNFLYGGFVLTALFENFKRIRDGFASGTVSFSKTPILEMVQFLMDDWAYKWVAIWAVVGLILYLLHANAERKKKAEAADKERLFRWLDEYRNKQNKKSK